MAAMKEHNIPAIDLLAVNLYPFEGAVARGADYEACVENIDIGGPAMIRAPAKNHAFVSVIVDVADYGALLSELDANDGRTTLAFRRRLAEIAYARTAAYDAKISAWMAHTTGGTPPRRRVFAGRFAQTLRYGENPHQAAAFYVDESRRSGVATATRHQGKELSYNNINDADAAFELVAEFDPAEGPACAIVKHGNPCGAARGATLSEACRKAFDCDRTSAFGGIIALNQPLDSETAEEIARVFIEVAISPSIDDAAKAILSVRKNLRLLTTGGLPDPRAPDAVYRQVAGGILVQDRDNGRIESENLEVVTKRVPTADEIADLLFAWRVAKHVKSNAIVYAKNGATVGIGTGQTSRLDSVVIAAAKAQRMADTLGLAQSPIFDSVVASDAFFPFADGLTQAAAAGASAVIQPGGSVRDDETIRAADEAGLAMVFTGMRHFRH